MQGVTSGITADILHDDYIDQGHTLSQKRGDEISLQCAVYARQCTAYLASLTSDTASYTGFASSPEHLLYERTLKCE